MDTKQCATCAHWTGDVEDRWEYESPEGVIWQDGIAYEYETFKPLDPQPPIPMRTCKGVPFFLRDDARAALAVVKDGSGYSGRLVTRPDFGCVLHTPRPEEPQCPNE